MWLVNKYIHFNTGEKNAANSFEKDVFKQMNDSTFDKQ